MNELVRKIQDQVKQTPFLRTEPQREAARVLGQLGLGTLGFGSTAAAVMMLRRKHEKSLLDEEKAQALLEVPVFVDEQELERNKKSAGVKTKAVAAGLGLLGLGSTGAGVAYSNGRTNGETSANPVSRVFNTATGIVPGGDALREEQARYLDLPGTVRGEHAKNFYDVPWFLPGALGVSLLGLGAGYSGINAIGNAMAKRKLQRRKKKVQKYFEDALRKEAGSELGELLEEFVTLCEASAPSVKEASVLEWYLALLGTAGMAGGLAGTYHGYNGATQKHRLAALKKIRQLQLAKRRSEELSLIPKPVPIHASDSKSILSNKDSDDDVSMQKSADLVRELAKGLWKGTKYLGGKTVQGVASATPHAAKVPKYLLEKQPLTTATVGTLLAAEGAGRVADHFGSPLGPWKPSNFVFNRFAENQPLTDANGKPIYGTRRLYSADPNDFAEMKWSWNPLSERGFGWRFRKQPRPRRKVIVTNSDPSITELVEKSNPSISMRRRMNERFYDYNH
jgi:hypothetical protein